MNENINERQTESRKYANFIRSHTYRVFITVHKTDSLCDYYVKFH